MIAVLLLCFSCSSFGALLFDCDKAPLVPEDRRVDKERLRVAHWNVEWLFLQGWSKRWSSAEEAWEHLEAVAMEIRRLSPDVINLAEVEDCGVLKTLVERIGDETYKGYLVKGTDTATGQNVALLTRVDPVVDMKRTAARVSVPVEGNTCGCTKCSPTTTAVSKHYYTTIQPTNYGKVHLIGSHLIAFPDVPDRCVQREGQSLVLQGLIRDLLKQDPKAHFVSFGDLNDYDGAVLDVANSKPISRSLAFLKDIIQEAAFPGDELINVAQNVAQVDRYTAYYNPDSGVCKPANKASTSIDHILISPSLQREHTITKFDTSLFPPPCAQHARPYSDHWPVMVEFDKTP